MRYFLLFLFIVSFPISLFATESLRDATYYSDSFEGGYTSNGDIFSQSTFSAAICGFDLGQYLYVHTSATGLVVRANDRPNCTKYPNLIDLSASAFQAFAALSAGKVPNVNVSAIASVGTNDVIKGFIEPSYFSDLGVILDTSLPNIFFSGDDLSISGKITNGEKHILFYLKNKISGNTVDLLGDVDQNGKFLIQVTLPQEIGNYVLVLAGGQSFKTDKTSEITLIDKKILSYPVLPTTNIQWIPKVDYNNKIPSLSLPSKTWGELKLTQDGNIYQTSGNTLILNPSRFSPGTASVQVSGYQNSTNSSLDRAFQVPSFFSGMVNLDYVHESTGGNLVSILNTQKNVVIRMKTPSNTKIRDTYFLTFPNGEVHEYPFSALLIGDDGFLRSNIRVVLSLSLALTGTYKLEFVDSAGLAYINIPVSHGVVWNILPSENIQKKKGMTPTNFFTTRINVLRAGLGYSLLMIDDQLSHLAQAKVDDMIARDYVGHINPDGLDILGFAKQKGLTFSGNVLGENIASGNVSDSVLQYGLEESGSHRMNMLRTEWRKIGIGYVTKNGQTYVVQIFGE